MAVKADKRFLCIAILILVANRPGNTQGGQAEPVKAEQRRFEAASIRPSTPGSPSSLSTRMPGRFVATSVSVVILISNVYPDISSPEFINLPDWARSERFDVYATTGEPVPPANAIALAPMVKALLEDRFGLRAHEESREQPAFVLTVAREDGRLGSRLKQSAMSESDCQPSAAPPQQPAAQATPRPLSPCVMKGGRGSLTGVGIPMSMLAFNLGGLVRRPIVDKTGRTGRMDFELSWAPEAPATPGQAPPTSEPEASVFTAIREQLGLKLEPGRTMMPVLVIDRLERPTEN